MPARHFPVSRSILATDALAGRIGAAYGLESVRCQLLIMAMRDIFLVTAGSRRFIFYLYPAAMRSPDEITGEWRLVDFLAQEGLPVIPALRTREGEWMLRFVAPEGMRYGVLTRYEAADHFRHRPGIAAARAYGRAIARLHAVTSILDENFDRSPVDPRLQLAAANRAISEAFPDRPDVVKTIQEAVQTLHPLLPAVPMETPYYGMIHGDVIRANALVADDGQQVTVIDFDLCGPGWRVYDVASFLITLYGTADEREMRAAFLEGYMGERSLKRVELEALPIYEAVRAVFSIGVPAGHIGLWGRAQVERFLYSQLTQLREYMARLEN